ncbi:MAG TPA: 2OG-Fe(II) oxygenase [Dongiaceae bacterium]|nr:2OG-Fe(II) oxygenase [Dongiaceae bacterium]
MSKKPPPKNPVTKKAAPRKPAKPTATQAGSNPAPEARSPAAAPAAQPAKPAEGYVVLGPGDPAPWFKQRSTSNPNYVFDTAAGRWLVLCFFGSAGDPGSRAALDQVMAQRAIFDDDHASFFGVSLDPKDEAEGRVAESMPGLRYFWDFDGAVARAYGAVPREAMPGQGRVAMRRFWAVIDPTMRIRRILPFRPDGSDVAELFACLRTLPPPGRHAGFEVPAPVLILPDVFEADFCRRLVALYEEKGGTESGFMREVEGRTVLLSDHKHKRRRDYVIEDRELIRQTQLRIQRRVAPEIQKVHQFQVTRMERYLIACYDAEEGGHFRAHRDNTTKGTAHRRFAVSVNLNDGFEGGEVSFPEYGPRGFKMPAGTACVFSCSLLHSVSPVAAGRRYAFLPFLYDDAAAKIREANNQFLGEGVGAYKAD